jgi:hypothetical protein
MLAVVSDHPIGEIGGSDDVEYYGGHLVAETVAPRNLPVIAAAPDMLTALKDTLAYWETTGFADRAPDCHCIVEQMRAAIAKAEGRS